MRVAVDVVGDAVLADGAARAVAARGELLRSHRLDAADKRLALRPEDAGAGEHLVEGAGAGAVVLEEAPRQRRFRGQAVVRDRAHHSRLSAAEAELTNNVPIGDARRARAAEVERQREVRVVLFGGHHHPALCVADHLKAREPAAFRLVGVDRKRLEAAAAWVRDVIGAAAERALVPRVDEVEHERRVDADRRMEAAWRLPRAIADARHELARRAGRLQRNRAAVAGEEMARFGHAGDLDLQPFDRRIDVADRAARAGLFPEHVPRLERLAQLDVHAAPRDRPERREPELEVRCEPVGLHRIAAAAEIVEHVAEVVGHEVGQHEAVVELRAPARQRLIVGASSRSGQRARAAGVAAPGSSARAAASRTSAARRVPGGRCSSRARRACRCRTRCDACCR